MIPSQMLKGILEGCILNIIAGETIYGYEISQRLKSKGFGDISEGTVYPLLLRLEKNGFLASVRKESPSGPPRKYYTLTEPGRAEADLFVKNWLELSAAVGNLMQSKESE
ncbi:MAG: PadR family transcriptional regulator [Bacillota bacterium]